MSRENNPSRISNDKSSSRKDRLLNFIYNSNNRLLKKDFPEKENNSEKISLSSLKKEIIYKLTSFSQEDRSVQFSPGIEEIECESRNDIDENDSFFMKLSNKKKFSTPPKKMKSSYKKTKEHIKTPYKTTKSRSTKNKSKNTNDINLNKNINEVFTGLCTEKNHSMNLEYYCKTHNKLYCAACISKIKSKGNGKHKNCKVFGIAKIKKKKKNILENNIQKLEELE